MAVNATPDVTPIGVVVAMESELQHLSYRVRTPARGSETGPGSTAS